MLVFSMSAVFSFLSAFFPFGDLTERKHLRTSKQTTFFAGEIASESAKSNSPKIGLCKQNLKTCVKPCVILISFYVYVHQQLT